MGMKPIWTFVVDFEGGTYVSQFEASTIEMAIKLYNEANLPRKGAVPLSEEAIPVQGLICAWCASGFASGSGPLILAHIIKTDAG